MHGLGPALSAVTRSGQARSYISWSRVGSRAAEPKPCMAEPSRGLGPLRVSRGPAHIFAKSGTLRNVKCVELIFVEGAGYHARAVTKFGKPVATALEADSNLGVPELDEPSIPG